MKVFLSADIGGTSIKLGIFSSDLKLLKKWSIKTNVKNNKVIVKEISNEFEKEIKENNYTPLAIGVGVPGFSDKNGNILLSGNIGWKNYNFKKEIQKFFNIPIVVHNDVNMHAYGEKFVGSAQDSKDFVVIAIGTGLGSGIFINDDLYIGHSGMAGEIGHMPFQTEYKCPCGLPMCLEPVFSTSALIKFYKENKKGIKDIDGRTINKLALENEPEALAAIKRLAENGAKTCAVITMMLNPEKIILSGGITTNNEIFLKFLIEEYKKYVFDYMVDGIKIELSKSGSDIGLYGCAFAASRLIK